MPVKPFICNSDKSLVKATLISTALVAADQQNSLAIGIKSKGYAPNFARPSEPHFLHVGVLRPLQCIDSRSPQARPKIPQQQGVGQQFILQGLSQGAATRPKYYIKYSW